jgi:uncharacterized protein YneF (UPF0154 family)
MTAAISFLANVIVTIVGIVGFLILAAYIAIKAIKRYYNKQ